jgi:lipopolysaccharide transport system ATP-binding protein
MPPIIRVENLSKRYRLGQTLSSGGYQRFSESLVHWAKSPLRWLRHGKPKTAHEKTPPQDFWALNDVSFEVQPGEVVGIIGRNGAGKSTLLKILSRITQPTAGRITLNGRVASLLEVGTGFHPELTGRENIYLNGAVLGMTKVEIKSKFDEIVAFAEVERFLDTPVKRYSSGMQVRLAFAVAAHLEPEILIVDEVLAVGDADFQRKCLGKMQSDVTSGRTVLFVSHQLTHIRTLCTRCLLLEKGQLVHQGSPSEVLTRYEHSPLDQPNTIRLDGPLGPNVHILAAHLEGTSAGPAICSPEDSAVLVIKIEFKVPILSLRVTLALFVNGLRLSTRHESPDSCHTAHPAGTLTLRAQLPLAYLNPGLYTVGLGLCDGHPAVYAWTPHLTTFTLIAGTTTPSPDVDSHPDHGPVSLPMPITRHAE